MAWLRREGRCRDDLRVQDIETGGNSGGMSIVKIDYCAR